MDKKIRERSWLQSVPFFRHFFNDLCKIFKQSLINTFYSLFKMTSKA